MNPSESIVAVTDPVETAGCVTWWNLSGMIDRAALAQLIPGDLMPSPVTPAKALARAVMEMAGRRRLVRPLPKHHGYAIVDEIPQADDTLTYETVCTVKLDTATDRPTVEPADHPLTMPLIDAFEQNLGALSPTDISTWLTDMAHGLKAVRLRPTGGIYFIPRQSLGDWKNLIAALKTCSAHFVAELPALRSTEAVEAILDAIQREAEAEVEKIEQELSEGVLGSRGIKNRVEHAGIVEEKVATYEALLNTRLDVLRGRLESLQANLAAAALKALADDEAA